MRLNGTFHRDFLKTWFSELLPHRRLTNMVPVLYLTLNPASRHSPVVKTLLRGHVMLPQTLATVYKSCAVLSCAAQSSSCGCIRVTSCSEQRGVIFKLAWSCRGAVLDHLRTQFGAVSAISRLDSLHPGSPFQERSLSSPASD